MDKVKVEKLIDEACDQEIKDMCRMYIINMVSESEGAGTKFQDGVRIVESSRIRLKQLAPGVR